MDIMKNLSEQKFPEYDPYKPLEESTGIKVEGSENMSLQDLGESFFLLSANALNLELNCFMIAYHIIMGPHEPLKKSEVERLKMEHENLCKEQLSVN